MPQPWFKAVKVGFERQHIPWKAKILGLLKIENDEIISNIIIHNLIKRLELCMSKEFLP